MEKRKIPVSIPKHIPNPKSKKKRAIGRSPGCIGPFRLSVHARTTSMRRNAPVNSEKNAAELGT